MKSSITQFMNRLVLVALICSLPMLTFAFGEGHAYAFTGSQQMSDLDLVLSSQDEQAPVVSTFSEQVITASATQSALEIEALAEYDLEYGDVVFMEYNQFGREMFLVRLRKSVNASTTIYFSGEILGDAWNDENSLKLVVGDEYDCGAYFKFTRNSSSRVWTYKDHLGRAPGQLTQKGEFLFEIKGQPVFAYHTLNYGGATPLDQPGGQLNVVPEFILAGDGEIDLPKSDIEFDCDWEIESWGNRAKGPKDQDPSMRSLADLDTTAWCANCNSSCDPGTATNDTLTAECNALKVLLVLDESGSISSTNAQLVRNAIDTFTQQMKCQGVLMGITEFATRGAIASINSGGYVLIDNAGAAAISSYLTNDYKDGSNGNSTSYQAGWLAALDFTEMHGAADLVIFFTDGQPNQRYSVGNTLPDYTVNGVSCSYPGSGEAALDNAKRVVNAMKADGTHIFSAGVAGATVAVLQEISGSILLTGATTIGNSDYVVGNFDQLTDGFLTFVQQLCPFSASALVSNICPGATNGSIAIDIPAEVIFADYTFSLYKNEVLDTTGMDDTTTLVFDGLPAAFYRIELTLQVSDSCTRPEVIDSIEVATGADSIIISESTLFMPSCADTTAGSSEVTVTQGSQPFVVRLESGGVMQPGYPDTISVSKDTATGLSPGAYSWILKDVNGCNWDTVMFTLVAPTGCCEPTCPPDTMIDCGTPTTAAFTGWPTDTVGCAPIDSIDVHVAGDCPKVDTITRYWRASNGDTICIQTIMVQDTTSPSITTCDSGPHNLGCNVAPTDSAAISKISAPSDDCGIFDTIVTVKVEDVGACLNSRTYYVVVRDSCLNADTCEVSFIWVNDEVDPTLTCDNASTHDLGCNVAPTDSAALSKIISATDNCTYVDTSVAQVGSDVTVGCVVTRVYEITLTDTCGNTANCQVSFQWVDDTTDPTLTCDNASTHDLGCNVAPTDSAALSKIITATDNCTYVDTSVAQVGQDVTVGCVVTRVYEITLTDTCGNTANCQVSFQWVDDTTDPVLTCDNASTHDLGCNVAPTDSAALSKIITATDNCTYVDTSVAQVGQDVTVGCVVTRVYEITLIDTCGNTANCQVSFQWVDDTTDPVLTCDNASTHDLGCNVAPTDSAALSKIISATDNCVYVDTSVAQVGSDVTVGCVVTRVYEITLTDTCGNTADCQVSFQWVDDTTDPVLTCDNASTHDLGCNVAPTDSAALSKIITATDNCTYVDTSVAQVGQDVTVGCVVTRVYEITLTDTCGNTADCQVSFQWVDDTTDPVLTCDNASTHDLGCNVAPTDSAALSKIITATDNCTYVDTSVAQVGQDVTVGCVVTRVYEITLTDTCGNTADCQVSFQWVDDTTDPVLTCDNASTHDLGCNVAPTDSAALSKIITATDNCTYVDTSVAQVGQDVTVGCVVTRVYEITLTDTCGNTANCQVSFQWVDDTTDPVLTCDNASTHDLGCNVAPTDSAALSKIITATDNCTYVDTSVAQVGQDVTVGCVVTRVYEITLTDTCGNTADCQVSFQWVDDTTDPVLTCDNASTHDLGCNVAPTDSAALSKIITATDNCTYVDTSVAQVGSDVTVGCVVTRVYEITLTDTCGNTADCQVSFQWVDDQVDPTLTCDSGPHNLGCNVVPTDSAALSKIISATDNCVYVDTSVAQVGSDATDGCVVTRVYEITLTDTCGNTSTCQTTFIWVDDEVDPTLTCDSGPHNLGCNVVPTDSAALSKIISATDNCVYVDTSVVQVGQDVYSRSVGCVVTRVYEITLTDTCGNTANCQVSFQWVEDTTDPVLTCDNASTHDLGCNVAPTDSAALSKIISATDNCYFVDTSVAQVGSDVTDGCVVTRVYEITLTDTCGNTADCQVSFQWVDDTTDPVLTCDNASTHDLGCNVAPTDSAALSKIITATDNCTYVDTSVAQVGQDVTVGCVVTRVYEITLTDTCGNTADCQVSFQWVDDTTDPVLTCDNASTHDLGCNVAPTDSAALSKIISATDNCTYVDTSVAQVGQDVTDGCVITRVYEITLTDTCGNTADCQVSFQWVDDEVDPTLTCDSGPHNLGCNVVPTDSAALSKIITATDNCVYVDTSVAQVGSDATDGCVVTRVYEITLTDTCGNTATCQTTFTWADDTTDPTITCPGPLYIECDTSQNYASIISAYIGANPPTVGDACGEVSVSHDWVDAIPEPSCDSSVCLVVTYTATDTCNNTKSCTMRIYIVDTTPPVIVCPADQTIEWETPFEYPPVEGGAPMSGSCVEPDLGGTAVLPAPCPYDGTMAIIDSFAFPPLTQIDIVSHLELVSLATIPGGTLGGEVLLYLGTLIMEMTGTGALAGFNRTLFVPVDGEIHIGPRTPGDPIQNMPAELFNMEGLLFGDPDFDFLSIVAGTNWGLPSPGNVTLTRLGPPGSDWNVDSFFDIEYVIDFIGAPGSVLDGIVGFSQGQSIHQQGGPVTVGPGGATATDDCSAPQDVTITFTDGPLLPTANQDPCNPLYFIRTWKATDDCGLMSTCPQRFDIVDTTPPVVNCPDGDSFQCDDDLPDVYADLFEFAAAGGTVDDNCGIDTSSFTMVRVTDTGSCPRTVKRVYRVADLCGNTGSCTQTFTINDTIPPVIDCPADFLMVCGDTLNPALNTRLAAWLAMGATATDNCDDSVVITNSFGIENYDTTGLCGGNVIQVVQFYAEDDCGNRDTCEATIMTIDELPPLIVCPPDTVIQCNTSTHPAATGMATATDSCNLDAIIPTYTDRFVDGSCAQEDTIKRKWLAVDDCGNSASCTQMITRIDTVAPTTHHTKPIFEEECIDSTEVPTFDDLVENNITAMDNCDSFPEILLISRIDTIFGSDDPLYPCWTLTQYTYHAKDDCDNFSDPSVISILYHLDTIPPVLACDTFPHLGCNSDSVPGANQLIADGWVYFVEQPGVCDNDLFIVPVLDATTLEVVGCDSVLTYRFRGFDDCGNNALVDCFMEIKWAVNKPIELTCPADTLTLECAGVDNDSLILAWLDDFDAMDSCSTIDTMYHDYLEGSISGGCGITGFQVVTFTALDSCGNMATCTAVLEIEDTTAPELECPENVSIECGLEELPAPGGYTVSDLCDDSVAVTWWDSDISGNCPKIVIRTYSAVDDCGNVKTCKQTITITDNTPPTYVCPDDVTVLCTESTDPVHTGAEVFIYITDGGTGPINTGPGFVKRANLDGSGVVTLVPGVLRPRGLTVDQLNGHIYWNDWDAGTTMRSDLDGSNVDTVFYHGTSGMNDIALDVCKEKVFITQSVGTAVRGVRSFNYDGSGLDTLYDSNANGGWFPDGIATDELNSKVYFGDVGILATDPGPAGIMRMNMDGSGWASLVPHLDGRGRGIALDLANGYIFFAAHPPGGPGGPGNADSLGRIWRSNLDGTGLTVIVDSLDRPRDVDMGPFGDKIYWVDEGSGKIQRSDLDGSNVEDVVTGLDSPDSFDFGILGEDNCDPDPDVTYSDVFTPACGNTGVIARTWTTTDMCGNQTACVQTITVVDTIDPVIACPSDTILYADAQCFADTDPTSTGMATADDNCDSTVTITFTDSVATPCAGEKVIIRTWTATDDCNNTDVCTQTITVRDTISPVISCPQPITVYADSNCFANTTPGATGMATATDNCDSSVTITFADSVVTGCAGEKVITRTWTATDDCNNTDICTQTITVQDTISPVISCPAHITVYADSNCFANTTPGATGFATATDNCDTSVTVTFADQVTFPCIGERVITRTWTATDDCDNTDVCTQTITVRDTISPVISCPASVTIYVDSTCYALSSPYGTGMATATDNCTGDTTIVITFSDSTTFPCAGERVITRTWTATDDCGNTDVCVQTITVQDTISPVITCPGPVTVYVDTSCYADTTPGGNGMVRVPVGTGMATATDNCDSSVVITFTDSVEIGCAGERVITRTWTATDDCNNTDVCTQIITVQDTISPVISCPDPVTVYADSNCLADTTPGATGMATATDNCDTSVTVTFSDSTVVGSCADERVITRTWTATDDCGNTDVCTQIITVSDTTAPQLECPENVSIECGLEELPVPGGYTVSDNCDDSVAVTWWDSDISGNCPKVVTRTYRAEDNCGNVKTCKQTITITDNTPPTYECPDDVTVLCTESTDPVNTGAEVFIYITDGGTGPINTGPGFVKRANLDGSGVVTLVPGVLRPRGLTVDQINGHIYWNDWDAGTTMRSDLDGSNVDTVLYHGTSGMNDIALDVCKEKVFITQSVGTAVRGVRSFNYDGSGLDTLYDSNANGGWFPDGIATDELNSKVYFGDVGIIAADGGTQGIMSMGMDGSGWASLVPHLDGRGRGIALDLANGYIFFAAHAPGGPGGPGSADPVGRIWRSNLDGTGLIVIVDSLDRPRDVDMGPFGDKIYWVDEGSGKIQRSDLDGSNVEDVVTGLDSPDSFDFGILGEDNCDPDPDVTYSDVFTPGCGNTGVIARTWTTTDMCGNQTACVQTITVVDTIAPTISCPQPVTVYADSNCFANTTPGATGMATATDNCDTSVTITFTDSVSVPCVGEKVITRTWTATDDCNNTDVCTQIITVRDTISPVISCPGPVTVYADSNCVANTTPGATGMATATDNCDTGVVITFSDSVVSGCAGERVITRTWTATDDCENTDVCVQTITVQDTISPAISCPVNLTLYLDADCSVDTDTSVTGVATASDNCDTAVTITFTDRIIAGSCPPEYTIKRKWLSVDDCGNTASCTQMIMVEDTLGPVVTHNKPAFVNCIDTADIPTFDDLVANKNIVAVDNCDDSTSLVIQNLGSFVFNNPVDCKTFVSYRYTATDLCGNPGDTGVITVGYLLDTIAPIIDCNDYPHLGCTSDGAPTGNDLIAQGYVFFDNLPGTCDAVLNLFNSGIDTIVSGCDSIAIFEFKATDGCDNNSNICYVEVKWAVETPLILTCPVELTLECGDTSNATQISNWLNTFSYTDTCSSLDTMYNDYDVANFPDSCGSVGMQIVTFTASDTCGHVETCYGTITILDRTAPMITCAPNKVQECDDSLAWDAPVSVTDACDPAPVVAVLSTVNSLDECGLGTWTRMWTATDCSGNIDTCAQVITVVDTTAPVITCAPNDTIECDQPLVFITPTVTDNCPVGGSMDSVQSQDTRSPISYPLITSVTTDYDTSACGTGTVTRTWVAADCFGNTATCSQVITIEDTTDPVITCAPGDTIECDEPVVFTAPTATDNCDSAPTIDPISTVWDTIDCGTGTVTRTWRATDCTGNTDSCTQTITIEDTTDPVITCAPGDTIECDEPVVFTAPTATDNCDNDPVIDSISTVWDTINCGTGTVTRTWRATDCTGNTDSCTQTITIEDTTDPVITCAPNDTIECDQPVVFTTPTATDNCDSAPMIDSISTVYSTGICGTGTVTRTWRATDCTGNSVTCAQVITIEDTTDPVITCAPGDTIECDQPVVFTEPTATDNCDTAPTIDSISTVYNTNDCGTGTVTRTWRVTDCTGNTDSCTQTITIEDTTDPVITCAPNDTIECDERVVFTMPTATDNCDNEPTIDSISTVWDTTDCGTGTVTRTWRATDCTGNTDSCTQTITIEDTTDPVITCAPNETIECDEPVVFTEPTATDNCDTAPTIDSISTVWDTSACGTGTVTRTWRATDCTGNTDSCTQTITIEDTTHPVITCVAGKTIECDAAIVFDAPGATDNCDADPAITIMSTIADTSGCSGTGTVTRTWIATDCSGLADTCSQTITIIDTVPPTMTCPDSLVVSCSDSLDFDTIIEAWANAVTATDACGVATVTHSLGDFVDGCLPDVTGMQVATFVASDECGNTYSCTAKIFFVDTVGPHVAHNKPLPVNCIDTADIPTFEDLIAEGFVFATDDCDTNPTIDFISDTTITFPEDHPTAPCWTALNILYTAHDACGNQGDTNTITVLYRLDTIDPVIVCDTFPHLGCTSENAPDAFDLIAQGYVYFDNPPEACDFDLIIIPQPQLDFTEVDGCDTVHWIAFKGIDGCANNSNICWVPVRWAVDAPIVPVCPDTLTLECVNPDNDSLITVWLASFTADDDCSDIDTTYNNYDPGNFSDGCGQTGIQVVTFTATDTCGHVATCQALIQIVDTTPPTIACPDTLRLECGDDLTTANPVIALWLASATGDDDCGFDTITTDYDSLGFGGGCGMTGMQVVTFTARDACGNTKSCTAKVIIEDTTAPTITCPDTLTLECTDDLTLQNPVIVIWLNSVTGSDTCSDVTFSNNYDPGEFDNSGCGLTGIQQVTFIAEDRCGNKDSCTAIVALADTTAPTITCPDTLILECDTLLTLANTDIVDWLNSATGSDGCGFDTITNNYDPFGFDNSGCGLTGEQEVTFIAYDECGNSDSCTALVILRDTKAPVLTCLDDVTVQCDSSLAGFIATAIDGCDTLVEITMVDTEIPGQFECLPIIVRLFTATDDCGNMSTCTMHITLEDTKPPKITCAPDVTIECDESRSATNTGFPTGVDNCTDSADINVILIGDIVLSNDPCLTIIERYWRVTDECGNGDSADSSSCIQRITIVDSTPPSFTCPDNDTITCGDELPTYSIPVTDNCDTNVVVTIVSEDSSGTCPIVVTRVYRAEDQCGNAMSCTMTITIEDDDEPEVTCPSALVIQCGESLDPDSNAVLAAWLSSATAVDDCGAAGLDSTNYDPNGFSGDTCAGSVQFVTFYASDACNNIGTCVAMITIVDTVGPAITCVDSITVECGTPVPFIPPTASDDCGGVGIDFSDVDIDSTNCPYVGGFVRTWTAMDECGNTTSCTQVVLFEDTTPPSITCPPNHFVECGDPIHPDSLGDMPTATDNCTDSADLVIALVSESIFSQTPCTTVLLRQWQATDLCGNGASGGGRCPQYITITDTQAPVITEPADTTIACGDALPVYSLFAADACDTTVAVVVFSEDSSGTCPIIVTRTYEAIDQCGNRATATQHITIEDEDAPTVTCPEALVIQCGESLDPNSNAVLAAWLSSATAADNCSAAVLDSTNYDENGFSGDTCVGSVQMVTFYASDACNNVGTCVAMITIVDTVPPVLVCPDSLIIECGDTSNASQITAWLATATASDSCSSATVSDDYSNGSMSDDCGLTGIQVVKFTAIDDCGNQTTCTAVIATVDTQGPVIVECPASDTLSWEEGIQCIDFDAYPIGVVDSVVLGGVTVNITAYDKFSNPAIEAWIFDSGSPTSGDDDLGTPNKVFGGPGISDSDPNGYNFSNNSAQGHVVVVQDPMSALPDDYSFSDSLEFVFSEPVFLQSIVNVDIEGEQANTGAGAYVYDSSGGLIKFVSFTSATGDNNQEDVVIAAAYASKLVVYFGDTIITSGAVAQICFGVIDKAEVSWDDCSEIQDTCSQELALIDECLAVFENTYSAVDECGNASDTCVETVTVRIDGERPEFVVCPSTLFLLCGDSLPDPDPSLALAEDNCTLPENIVIEWVLDDTIGLDEDHPANECDLPAIRRIYRATDECGNVAHCVQFIFRINDEISLDARALLQAAVVPGTDSMDASLLNSILPLTNPYGASPYLYPGGDAVAVMPANAVDWVLVRLLDTTTQIILAERAALLLDDGSIVDTNGTNVTFVLPEGHYDVVIAHRNHLDVISRIPVDFTGGVGTHDFVTDWVDDLVVPEGGLSGLVSGVTLVANGTDYAMIQGDANSNNRVSYIGGANDRSAILTRLGPGNAGGVVNGYYPEDINFDGKVTYIGGNNDKSVILTILGAGNGGGVIIGQVP